MRNLSLTVSQILTLIIGLTLGLGVVPAHGVQLSLMDLRKGYGLDDLPVDGTGQRVAIILSNWADPDQIVADINSAQTLANQQAAALGLKQLPAPKIVVKYSGDPPEKSDDESQNMDKEGGIDPQMVYAMAPGASIFVVISGPSIDEKIGALKFAIDAGASIVSMSYGSPQGVAKPAYVSGLDGLMAANPMITFIAGSGDSGANPDGSGTFRTAYPASSPYVIAVGGVNEDFSDNPPAWKNSGGGQSAYYSRPQWQTSLAMPGTGRMLPDLSMAGGAGAPITTFINGTKMGMTGTSASAPLFAGVMALANQFNNGAKLGDIHKFIYSPIYNNAFLNFYRDSKSGNNGYPAKPGYDMVTGLGVPKVAQFLNSLARRMGTCRIDGTTKDMLHGNCNVACRNQGGKICTWNTVTVK